MNLLYLLISGAIAGWLAGKLMKRGGFGLLLNIVLGIVGSFVGNWLFKTLGMSIMQGNMVGDILTGAIGASLILFIAGLFKK